MRQMLGAYQRSTPYPSPSRTETIVTMTAGYVYLVCGVAVILLDVVTAFAFRGRPFAPDAVQSLGYALFFVAGVGSGLLHVRTPRPWAAARSGLLAGALTGAIETTLGRLAVIALGLQPAAQRGGWSWPVPAITGAVTVLTAASLGALGGLVGWGVRRTVGSGR
jgi:type IV secretory pathway VirB2 component (pilin)